MEAGLAAGAHFDGGGSRLGGGRQLEGEEGLVGSAHLTDMPVELAELKREGIIKPRSHIMMDAPVCSHPTLEDVFDDLVEHDVQVPGVAAELDLAKFFK